MLKRWHLFQLKVELARVCEEKKTNMFMDSYNHVLPFWVQLLWKGRRVSRKASMERTIKYARAYAYGPMQIAQDVDIIAT